jgi:hypothetical protein
VQPGKYFQCWQTGKLFGPALGESQLQLLMHCDVDVGQLQGKHKSSCLQTAFLFAL